jgi:hypothetical protein
VFAASDWAIELKLLMATIDRRLVAETSLLDIFLLSHAGPLPSLELSDTKVYEP